MAETEGFQFLSIKVILYQCVMFFFGCSYVALLCATFQEGINMGFLKGRVSAELLATQKDIERFKLFSERMQGKPNCTDCGAVRV